MQMANNFWDKLRTIEEAHEKMFDVVAEIIEMYLYDTEAIDVYVSKVETSVKTTGEKIFYVMYEEEGVPSSRVITVNQLKEKGFEI